MISTDEAQFIDRAVELAETAEAEGNLPIGAVLTLDGEIVGEGGNRIVVPHYDPGLHAEIVAVRSVAPEHWNRASEMTCYSTLEPCVMCTGTLLLHGVGRVVFGAVDPGGGGGKILQHLPDFFANDAGVPDWVGPVAADRCDPLTARAQAGFAKLPCGQRTPRRRPS